MASKGGQPGNKNATKGKLFDDVIRRALMANDAIKLREIVDQLVDKAAAGDSVIAFELIDRMDGKAKQPIEHSGDADNPLSVIVASSAAILKKLRTET